MIFFTCIKLNFYLRIFDGLGYLVQMAERVFYDLQYFILFYVIIISAISIMVSLIIPETSDATDSDTIGPVVYFIMTLRTSLGDGALDVTTTTYTVLFWIIYLLVMFVGNIVLMNFIIAVVGDSYGTC